MKTLNEVHGMKYGEYQTVNIGITVEFYAYI